MRLMLCLIERGLATWLGKVILFLVGGMPCAGVSEAVSIIVFNIPFLLQSISPISASERFPLLTIGPLDTPSQSSSEMLAIQCITLEPNGTASSKGTTI